jgi:uncharacterized protein (TIGR02300 family)
VAREPPLKTPSPRKTDALANPELGAKQICPNCQAKFYDLQRRPAVCPKCATSFDPEEVVRSRRVRSRAAPDYETDDVEDKVKEADVDALEDEEEVDDTPELDEGAEIAPLEPDEDADIDPGAPSTPDPDLGVGIDEEEALAEEDDADVPFLEDDDEFPEDEIEGLPEEDGEDH